MTGMQAGYTCYHNSLLVTVYEVVPYILDQSDGSHQHIRRIKINGRFV